MYITRENAKEVLGASLLTALTEVLYDSSIFDRYATNVENTLKAMGEHALARRVEARRLEWHRLEQAREKLRAIRPADTAEYHEAEEAATDYAELEF